MEVHNKKTKPELTESHFICKFEYGINMDRYWNYSTMVLQLEDVIDCLRVLYGDEYEYIFFFDHSSGHDWLRPDGLNALKLNKNYGGAQPNMRTCPFSSTLDIGETQHFQFKESDEGPFHLSSEERRRRKYDFETGETEIKNYTHPQLIKKIKECTDLWQITGNVEQIQQIAKAHNVPTSFQKKSSGRVVRKTKRHDANPL